jgi:two-component SAPR family response regulator
MPDPRQIVVVEDVFVGNYLRAALERQGHTVSCPTSAEAMRRLQTGQVDLLVTNSPTAFSQFGDAVPLLYLAAFPEPAFATAFRVWLPLRKPFQTSELTAAVERLLGTR